MDRIISLPSGHSQKQRREQMKLNYLLNHKISPCVLQVPESLKVTKPEAYVPQMVGLGPYHHSRPEVLQMESEKGAAIISYLEGKDISDLVANFEQRLEPEIRSCYDGYLDLDEKALTWVLIVDSLFLLDFLSAYLNKSNRKELNIYSNIEALVPDIMMLENQIPIFLLRGWLECFAPSKKLEENILEFCEKQTPLKLASDKSTIDDAFRMEKHMLHYMYKLIVKNQSQKDDDLGKNVNENDGNGGSQVPNSTIRVGELAKDIGLLAGEIFGHAVEEFNTALADAKLAGLEVPGNVEKVSNILRNLQKILHLDHMKGSLGNQIDIPSASRLNTILKLKFKPLPDNCGIGDIKLEKEKKTLHLPVITLNSNSEVILRNLLAYESTFKMRSTKLQDYMDLICGIIKSEKDVTLLREKKIIIIKGLLTDAEIVRMCNGIKKSDEKSDENSNVHQTVMDVKEEFNKAGIVKACRSTTKCFAALVKYIFPILVLLFLALQLFCGIYDCRRSSYGGAALRNSYLGELELDPKAKLMLPRKVYRY